MLELVHRSVKALVFVAVAWVVIQVVQNTGFRKVEEREMEPDMKQDDFKIVLSQKRLPGVEIQRGDIVSIDYYWPGRKKKGGGEVETLTGRVFGMPGDLIWVENKIVSPEMPQEGLEARAEKPSKEEEDRFVPVVVPRDSYFVLCRNQKEYSVYDSRGVGTIGMWAVRGRMRK